MLRIYIFINVKIFPIFNLCDIKSFNIEIDTGLEWVGEEKESYVLYDVAAFVSIAKVNK